MKIEVDKLPALQEETREARRSKEKKKRSKKKSKSSSKMSTKVERCVGIERHNELLSDELRTINRQVKLRKENSNRSFLRASSSLAMARSASTSRVLLRNADSTRSLDAFPPIAPSSPRRTRSFDTVSSFPVSSPRRGTRSSFDIDVSSSVPTSPRRIRPFESASPRRRCCPFVPRSPLGLTSSFEARTEFEAELIVEEERREDLANDIHKEYEALMLRRAQRRRVVHEIAARG
eukprot:scaffold11185_cov205-Amphora_coffeaeformis.AAC.2